MSEQRYSALVPLVVGFTAITLLIGGVGLWSVRTQIAGAIIASGIIVVENNRQIVQHAEGGVVGKIIARDGDTVTAGALLIQLDDTLLRSELSVAELQLVELSARRGRLTAERDGALQITVPDNLTAYGPNAAAEQMEGQRKLFEARLQSLENEQSQIGERIKQAGNQIKGAEAQLNALAIQEDLITEELTGQETLLEKGLVQAQRVSTLRREAARLAGEIGEISAGIAQFRGEIAAFEIERLKLETTRRENAIVELRDIQFRELELSEQRRSLLERLARLDIRAPVGGIVYGSTVFAQNSVVRPAEALMYVVPQDQPLIVSARIEAIHIDQVRIGQTASLLFTSFNQRLTPAVSGRVIAVSADVFQDETTGVTYYKVDIVPLESELSKLKDQEVLPGMPVETHLRTEDRTPLSYLTKPLTDYFGRALREG